MSIMAHDGRDRGCRSSIQSHGTARFHQQAPAIIGRVLLLFPLLPGIMKLKLRPFFRHCFFRVVCGPLHLVVPSKAFLLADEITSF